MQQFTGKEYLKIDIASNFGLDKADWSDRIAWFDQNEHQLRSLVQQAEEPALFYAGVKAWEDTQAGQPTGHLISLDATNSGLQILAALTGDLTAAEICNVVDTGHCRDAYMEVYHHMLGLTGGSAKISRPMAKEAVMTSLYGSQAVPKRVFGEGQLLAAFYQTMETLSPAAWELNEAMLALWDSNALSHDWVLPDNFHVHIKVMDTVAERIHFLDEPFDVFHKENRPVDQGRSLGANLVHSIDGMIVRELTRRCDYNVHQIEDVRNMCLKPGSVGKRTETVDDDMVLALWDRYQKSGYLSARILDHLKFENFGHVQASAIKELLNSLPNKPFKVVSVHDCFRCLANYGNDLRWQYNHQLSLIARSEMLSYLVSQIIQRPINIGKLHPQMWRNIEQANYAIC